MKALELKELKLELELDVEELEPKLKQPELEELKL